ncbi:MAG TPA: DUF2079 domain-containing protein [Trebonia sp.]|nr:DUF2079 domain-containing protein [Trebonia sp.]
MPGEYGPRALGAGAGTDVDSAAMRRDGQAAPGSPWRDPVTWALAALVFCVYFVISLFRLLRLSPASYDLGIYTEYVKQLSLLRAPIVDVRGPGFNLLGDHFQVGLAVLAPFFRLFPSPATLLFFQALATALSVFPVIAAGSALLGRPSGRAIGFAYGFSWGLQQMINFDFHEIALAVPLLAFSLSALIRGRLRATALWAMPLVFIKEDQGFTVAAIGALLVFDGVRALAGGPAGSRRGSIGWGALLFGWGLTWSVLAITVIIPHFNALHSYYYWKDGGVVGGNSGFSPGSLVVQTASGWPVKLQTVIMLLLPTAFASLGSPLALVALPSLALRFVSTNSAYWGTDFHYSATLMPILFIAAVEALARWRAVGPARRPPGPDRLGRLNRPDRLGRPIAALGDRAGRLWVSVRGGLARHAAAMMAAVAVALAFQFPLSGLWHGSSYTISSQVAADNAAMAVVPDGATVQTTLNLLAPLAARTDTFWMGNSGNPLTEYLVIDGKNSGYSPAPTNVPAFIAELYPTAGYRQIFSRSDVYVFRRG